MREIIQKVVASEAEARQRVDNAREAAAELIRRTRAEALERTQKAREEGRAAAAEIVATATAEAERQKAELLRRAAAGLQSSIRLEESTRSQIAAAAADWVRGAPG